MNDFHAICGKVTHHEKCTVVATIISCFNIFVFVVKEGIGLEAVTIPVIYFCFTTLVAEDYLSDWHFRVIFL